MISLLFHLRLLVCVHLRDQILWLRIGAFRDLLPCIHIYKEVYNTLAYQLLKFDGSLISTYCFGSGIGLGSSHLHRPRRRTRPPLLPRRHSHPSLHNDGSPCALSNDNDRQKRLMRR